MMQVHIQNDGPVTLQFETPNIPTPKTVLSRYQLNIPANEKHGRNNFPLTVSNIIELLTRFLKSLWYLIILPLLAIRYK